MRPHRTRGDSMILVFFLILSAAYASAAEPYAAWKYWSRIQAPDARIVALPLRPQNFDLSEKRDLSDFRIVDSRGLEVPYAVAFETELRSETNLRGTEINREYPDSSTSRITVDFGSPVTKNRISVETTGNSFRRLVRVEGSDDLRQWSTLLPEGWLIAAGDTPEKRFESLDIGSNTYRFVRVSVIKMPDEKEAPGILQVSCRHLVIRRPSETSVPSILSAYSTRDRTSTAEIDFGTRNLPVQRLQLLLGRDPARIFEKRCDVYGRNSRQHTERIRFESGEYGKTRTVDTAWEYLGSAVLYRNAQDQNSLALPVPAKFRYVQIRIQDGDSPPLEVSGVTGYAVPAYLVFEPAGQSRFELYTGNAEAPVPRYQTAQILASMDTRSLAKCPETQLARRPESIPHAQPQGRRFVWGILGLAVLFTAWILWNTARSIGRERNA